MGVIKSDPQGAMHGCHMCGIAVSLYGIEGLAAAGECFYSERMLQVVHTIT